jgi:hypothetical protein
LGVLGHIEGKFEVSIRRPEAGTAPLCVNVVKEVSRNGNMWKAVLAPKQIPAGTRDAEDMIDSCEYISVMMQGNPKGQDVIRGENNA